MASGGTAYGAHAEGYETTAYGNYGSHSEGYLTTAIGNFGSHAEGNETTAIGNASHAEGNQTTAIGIASHAGGINSSANGSASFVHGNSSTATNGAIVLGSLLTGTINNVVYVNKIAVVNLPSYATDAAADADTTLPSGGLYKLNSGRAVYEKP